MSESNTSPSKIVPLNEVARLYFSMFDNMFANYKFKHQYEQMAKTMNEFSRLLTTRHSDTFDPYGNHHKMLTVRHDPETKCMIRFTPEVIELVQKASASKRLSDVTVNDYGRSARLRRAANMLLFAYSEFTLELEKGITAYKLHGNAPVEKLDKKVDYFGLSKLRQQAQAAHRL